MSRFEEVALAAAQFSIGMPNRPGPWVPILQAALDHGAGRVGWVCLGCGVVAVGALSESMTLSIGMATALFAGRL